MEHNGVPEYWSYPDDNLGDCEDYALENRRTLTRKAFASPVCS
ncbi:transglutaminase-like cysteine peptidase [Mesorhizobium sp. C280B]